MLCDYEAQTGASLFSVSSAGNIRREGNFRLPAGFRFAQKGRNMAHRTDDEANTHEKPQPNRVSRDEIHGSSALSHVGPTLESDLEFNGIGSKGYDTPEAAIAGEAPSGEIDSSAVSEEGFDPVIGRRTEAPRTGRRPERLITHLAGDTSSEPHTDVGPDNATTVQHRGERKER